MGIAGEGTTKGAEPQLKGQKRGTLGGETGIERADPLGRNRKRRYLSRGAGRGGRAVDEDPEEEVQGGGNLREVQEEEMARRGGIKGGVVLACAHSTCLKLDQRSLYLCFIHCLP